MLHFILSIVAAILFVIAMIEHSVIFTIQACFLILLAIYLQNNDKGKD